MIITDNEYYYVELHSGDIVRENCGGAIDE